MVPIGAAAGGEPAPAALESPDPIDHPTAKLSHWERSYDEIVQAHQQTSLDSPAEAQLWHQEPFPWNPAKPGFLNPDGIEKVILRRGSKRVFEPSSIPIEQLAGILDHATYRLDCDWGEQISQVGLIAHDVEDLESGSYAYAYGFDLIDQGNFREKAQQLCLKQPLGGDGAATIFLLADLEDTIRTLGKRGYRAAQLDAGITAGRIYLGAYSCGFGATGLTFFDDEVREFFHTEAEPMLVVAVGY
jgi:nitroreductase